VVPGPATWFRGPADVVPGTCDVVPGTCHCRVLVKPDPTARPAYRASFRCFSSAWVNQGPTGCTDPCRNLYLVRLATKVALAGDSADEVLGLSLLGCLPCRVSTGDGPSPPWVSTPCRLRMKRQSALSIYFRKKIDLCLRRAPQLRATGRPAQGNRVKARRAEADNCFISAPILTFAMTRFKRFKQQSGRGSCREPPSVSCDRDRDQPRHRG
jgi:hypothetical protein